MLHISSNADTARDGRETLHCSHRSVGEELGRVLMPCHAIQVRSTGPVNALTHQPIKGRKFGGGIRFGEMERDALLAHGSAYLLHDRLHMSSDYAVLDACQTCGSILTPITQPRETAALGTHLASSSGAPSSPEPLHCMEEAYWHAATLPCCHVHGQ